jgi:hypothetical protein
LIEHACRQVLRLQVLRAKETITILRMLLDAIKHRGKPKATRTDNEAIFRSCAFASLCAGWTSAISDVDHDRNLARAAARRSRAGNAQDDGGLSSAGKPAHTRCESKRPALAGRSCFPISGQWRHCGGISSVSDRDQFDQCHPEPKAMGLLFSETLWRTSTCQF